MKDLFSFSRYEHGSRRVLSEFKNVLLRKLTMNSSTLFLRGGDIISIGPQANTLHEPDLTSLIDHCADTGYVDFLIDIGANIGLTTSQNGSRFHRIFCFEPNPLCVHILKVNIDIAGVTQKTEVCEYGLGESEGAFDLWIPRHNWGGAFVKSNDNNYSEKLLLAKDGFSKFDQHHYLIRSINIRQTKTVLEEKFVRLSADKLVRGVIKIDVEGMERVVLKGIADAMPSDISAVILFENWDSNFDYQEILDLFARRKATMLRLNYKRPFGQKWPRVLKAASLVLRSTELHLEAIESSEDRRGDIVVVVE